MIPSRPWEFLPAALTLVLRALVIAVLLVIAITFGTINIVGGFLVTDRMLEMFKSKPKPPAKETESGAGETRSSDKKGSAP